MRVGGLGVASKGIGRGGGYALYCHYMGVYPGRDYAMCVRGGPGGRCGGFISG